MHDLRRNKHWLVAFMIFMVTLNNAYADQVVTLLELAALPEYCRGTQLINKLSGDSGPDLYNHYRKILGKTYHHLHHYCWALNTENRVATISDRWYAQSQLRSSAMGDINYVLERAEPGFKLLPEIYSTKARILFKLQQDADARAVLQQAIKADPKYVPAYTRLSDSFVDAGDKDSAIAILKQGIQHAGSKKSLTDRLKVLTATTQ